MSVDDSVEWSGVAADLVAMEPLGGDRFRNRASIPANGDRIFGGQMVAQCLAAGQATTDRPPQSLHLYFIAGGSGSRPVEFRVERVRDGGSSSLRQVEAWQGGRLLARMACSFRASSDGHSHQIGPDVIQPPEDCEDHRDFVARTGDDMEARMLARMTGLKAPVELRLPVQERIGAVARPPLRRFWMRVTQPIGDDPRVRSGLLAYLSDYWMAGTAMMPHLGNIDGNYPAMISLDHAVWFHRPARADDWLLYELDSPAFEGGTALTRGMIYDRQGRAVASTAQETLPSLPR